MEDHVLGASVFVFGVVTLCRCRLPGWKMDKLPSVCPNTSFPFLVGCHLNRQMSDRKECASLWTVTPGSEPPYTPMYSGPRWETNATPSAEFQHQLTDTGTPEDTTQAGGEDLHKLVEETDTSWWRRPTQAGGENQHKLEEKANMSRWRRLTQAGGEDQHEPVEKTNTS